MDSAGVNGPRIALDLAALHDLCVRHRLKDVFVFGSALREDFRPDSDVDFVIKPLDGDSVSFNEFLEIQDELSSMLRRPVDLVLFSQLESPSANPIRRRNILQT